MVVSGVGIVSVCVVSVCMCVLCVCVCTHMSHTSAHTYSYSIHQIYSAI